MKTQSNIRPTQLFEFCKDTEDNFVVFNDLDSIEETEGEDGTIYHYNTYQMKTPTSLEYIEENAEKIFALLKQNEYDELASQIRAKRNRLLDESDKYMALDYLNLDTSSAIKFLASLKNIFSNSYAEYRQALRDITEQEGFPYNVVFPEKPE